MNDTGTGLTDLGGAVSSIFGAIGSEQAASAYEQAAKIALKNEELTRRSTAIEETQQGIQTYKVMGAEVADTAGAGFSMSGSAIDLLKSSAQQAAMSKSLIAGQGEITALGFEEQANAYQGQAAAAQTAGAGGFLGGLLKIGAAVAAFSG